MVSGAPKGLKRGLSFQSVLSLSLSEEKKEELFKGGNDFLGSCLGFLGFRERCFFFESEEGLRGEMSNLRQKKKHNTHTVRRRLYTSREREKREGKRERRRRRRPSFTSSPSPSLPLSHFFLGGGGRFGRRKREDIDRNCDTSRLYYYNLCAEREHETRARESERKREKRGGGRSTSLSLAGVLCWIA